MAQLHFYVSDDIEASIRQRAEAQGLSVSKYLSQIIKKELQSEWPDDFFENVIGGWQGPPLERPGQGVLEVRSGWDH